MNILCIHVYYRYNYVAIDPVAEPMDVAPGDVVAYFATAGRLATRVAASDDSWEHTSIAAPLTVGANVPNTFSAALPRTVSLRAIAAKTVNVSHQK